LFIGKVANKQTDKQRLKHNPLGGGNKANLDAVLHLYAFDISLIGSMPSNIASASYTIFLRLCTVAADKLNATRDDVTNYLPYGQPAFIFSVV